MGADQLTDMTVNDGVTVLADSTSKVPKNPFRMTLGRMERGHHQYYVACDTEKTLKEVFDQLQFHLAAQFHGPHNRELLDSMRAKFQSELDIAIQNRKDAGLY